MTQNLIITEEQREQVMAVICHLMKENAHLQQQLAQEQRQETAATESLSLEILEIFDAVESLTCFCQDQSGVESSAWKRMSRSLNTIQKKILHLLKQEEIYPIKVNPQDLNFEECKVIDREIRADLVQPEVIKIIRQGFYCQTRILRPVEIILGIPATDEQNSP